MIAAAPSSPFDLAQAWDALGLPPRLPVSATPLARVQHRVIGLLLRQARAAVAVPATEDPRPWRLGWVCEADDILTPIDAAHPPKRFVWLSIQATPTPMDVAQDDRAKPLYDAIHAHAPWPRRAPAGLDAGIWADEEPWQLDAFQAALPALDPVHWQDLKTALAAAAAAVPDPLRAWAKQHTLRHTLPPVEPGRARPRF